MKDSDTYLAILDKGREEEARDIILRQGEKRFGPADQATAARLSGITDLARLNQFIDLLFDASATSWQDLLDTP